MNVYEISGVTGIGFRIQTRVYLTNSPWGYNSFFIDGSSVSWDCGVLNRNCDDPYIPEGSYQIDIVATKNYDSIKTGPVGFPSTIASVNFDSAIATKLQLTPTKITLKASTCDFAPQQSSLLFSMGDVSAATFTGMGSLSPLVAPSNAIAVTCDKDVSMNMTLSGTQAQGGNDSAVALNNREDMATGIGVQFLYDNNIMHLNEAIGPITLSEAATTYTLPLTARYIQTAPAVTAGVANTTAVLQVTYN